MAHEAVCPACGKWAEIMHGFRWAASATTQALNLWTWRFDVKNKPEPGADALARPRSIKYRTCGCIHKFGDRVPNDPDERQVVDPVTGEVIPNAPSTQT